MTSPSELSVRWRERGDELDPYSPAAAEAFRRAADELDEALQAEKGELLSPAAASTESGLSKRRIRELDAEGKLANHGRKGAPLYKRGDLPRRRAKGAAGGFAAEGYIAGIIGGESP